MVGAKSSCVYESLKESIKIVQRKVRTVPGTRPTNGSHPLAESLSSACMAKERALTPNKYAARTIVCRGALLQQVVSAVSECEVRKMGVCRMCRGRVF